jgi:CDP-diacylglycerol---glycerol-3-phosphate 3-phosphatidyltransferase
VSPDLHRADGDTEVRERGRRSALGAAVRRWLEAAAGLVAFTVLLGVGIAAAWPAVRTIAFAGWGSLALGVAFVAVGISIERTFRSGRPERLTLASWVTLLRGAALATFVGFLAIEAGSRGSATSFVAWLPALAFAAAGLLDAVDGAIARRTDAVTELGARLDVEFDALVTLVGAIAAVAVGGAHVAFLLVGAARYLYVSSLWSRRRRGRPVRKLSPSRIRAPLSALVLVAIWLALTPVVSEGPAFLLTTAVAVPFLLNFLYDWLVTTTRVPPSPRAGPGSGRGE